MQEPQQKEFRQGAHAATAAMDHVSVGVLIKSLVKRHPEYIDSLNAFSETPRFSRP